MPNIEIGQYKKKIQKIFDSIWNKSEVETECFEINNTTQLSDRAQKINLELSTILNALHGDDSTPYNVYNDKTYEEYINLKNEEQKMKNNSIDDEILDMYRDIKAENKIINNKIETTRWLLTILITVFGIFTPLMFNIHARGIDAKFETINTKIESIDTNINSKFELIEQRLDSQKELNQLQIQRDVSQELLKQKK